MINIIQLSFVSIVTLLIVALGGLMSEKSGVTNIALEGLMLLGGFVGAWTVKALQTGNPPILLQIFIALLFGAFIGVIVFTSLKANKFSFKTQIIAGIISAIIMLVLVMLYLSLVTYTPNMILIFAILVAGFVGGLVSLLHAYAAITMNADQTISATAINLFAPAVAIFIARSVLGGQQVKFRGNFRIDKVPILGDIPIIGEIFFQKTYLSFYIAILILIVIWIFLYKTKTGLRIIAVGENPHAADAQGINIYRIRYFSVIMSGILAGIGGVIFVVTTSVSFDATVAGMGFLAIAVLIFGNWEPRRILLSAIFFGFFRTIASAYSSVPFLANLNLSREIYGMIPFILTLIVLAFSSKSSRAPKAIGRVYDKGER